MTDPERAGQTSTGRSTAGGTSADRNTGPLAVKVRVWVAHQQETRNPVDVDGVVNEVARIWHRHGIQLSWSGKPGAVRDPVIVTGSADQIRDSVYGALAAPVNGAIDEGTERHIDLALVPAFHRWGQAYTPLVPVSGDSPATFAPFHGPVAIVATVRTIDGVGEVLERTGSMRPHQTTGGDPDSFVRAAVANDAAHEIGHLFGLFHTTDNRRGDTDGERGMRTLKPATRAIFYLIHENLYNGVAKLVDSNTNAPRSIDFPKVGVTKSWTVAGLVGDEEAGRLYDELPIGQSDEWFVALRGEHVSPPDLRLVHDNITRGKVWQGS
jgi:hypothetical protein